MRVHRLKSWARFWDAVFQGNKTFEIRKDDRDFEVGDILELVRVAQVSPHEPTDEPPRILYKRVSYISCSVPAFGLEPGYVVLALVPAPHLHRPLNIPHWNFREHWRNEFWWKKRPTLFQRFG